MDTNAVIDGDGTVESRQPRNEVDTAIAAAEDEHHEEFQSFATFPFLSLRIPIPNPAPFPSSPVPAPPPAAHTTNKKASRKTKTKTVLKTRPTTIKIRRTVFADRRSKHGRFIRNISRVFRKSTSVASPSSSSATAAARRPLKASDEVFHTANQKSMGSVGSNSSEGAFASAVESLEEESDGGDSGGGVTEVDRSLEPSSNLNTNPTASSSWRGASSALKRKKYNNSTIHDNADDDEKEFDRKWNELNNTRIRDPSNTGANKKDDDNNGCHTVAPNNTLTEPKHTKKRRCDHHKRNETIHPPIERTTTKATTPTMEMFFKSGHEGIAYSFINYLENDEKIQLACTCSSMNKHVLNGKGIDVPVDPLIFVSPSDHNHDDSIRGERFLRNMLVHHQDERKKTILHNHYRIKIENVRQFNVTFEFCNTVTVATTAENLAEMRSITELDISSPTLTRTRAKFVVRLMMMFPNLRKINLTNIIFAPGLLAEYCPRLETIIWKYTTHDRDGCVWSRDFASFRHLKAITLDNRSFFFNQRVNGNDNFLFQQCASNNPMLARVSMKHAIDIFNKPVAQGLLMKFVRNVPSVTYFRSDLTPENIAILQLERPAMVFE